MSVISRWSALEQERKQVLFMVHKTPSQFDSIAELCGFKKQDMDDLYLLMKELGNASSIRTQNEGKEEKSELKETENKKHFKYDSDFDENGIIYWIGTQRGKTTKWENPTDKSVVVTTSTLTSGQLSGVIGRVYSATYSDSQPNSWAIIDFGQMEIIPDMYTLRHGYSVGDAYMMNWRFEGMKKNGNKWEVIRRHRNEITLKCNERTASWKVDCDNFYSKFRVIQYGANNRPDHYLCLSGFEIYGVLKYFD
eukprot:323013_1